MRATLSSACCLLLLACGDADAGGGGGGGTPPSTGPGPGAGGGAASTSSSSGPGTGGGGTGDGFASEYPGDVGIASDPRVVWAEDCESESVDALVARYDDAKSAGIALDPDVPPESSGATSCAFTASGAGPNAVDVYKRLEPGHDELFVRWYARYEAGVPWHHSGMWIGGYNPSSPYPSPQAGLRPDGDDRFHFSIEPMEQGASPRMDFYAYWMNMHSWMEVPSGDTAYYGNSLIHDPTLTAEDAWQCFELHLRLNSDPASAAGAELGLWRDDASVVHFDQTGPLGYWVRDKFCPDDAVGTECTDYRPAEPVLEVLDLQVRSTTDLEINAFWPQNYITGDGSGTVYYDDMIVATERIGCIR